jgi:predicted metal-binding membrane protein
MTLRDKSVIVIALLLLTVLAWITTVQQSEGMGMGLITMSMTMGQPLSIQGAALYIVLWGVMMIAMMFPALAPTAILFATINRQKQHSQTYTPAWLFVAGYAALWTFTGSIAYAGDIAIQSLPELLPFLRLNSSIIGGATLVVAGLYQLTPLKDLCLSKCRSPLGFLLNSWQNGRWGAFNMGLLHGAYCLGCCWSLMAVLFVVGTMNLVWMAILSLIIFFEKILVHGVAISKVAGAALIGAGMILIMSPTLLAQNQF